MIFLALAIFFSALNIWIFKLYQQFDIKIFQAIVTNYFVCVALGLVFSEIPISLASITGASWLPISAFLGLLFIGGFNLIAITTQRVGVAAVTVASKISMILPIAVAIIFYSDVLNWQKVLGVFMAIGAIFFTAVQDKSELKTLKKAIILPLLVWFSSGIIEILLDYVQRFQLESSEFPAFLVANFGLAGLIGLVALLFWVFTGKMKLGAKHIFAGVCLGFPNYGSLYFLLKALKESGLESSELFPIANIGIVLLAIIGGMVFFKEKLTPFNWIGVGLAIGAIAIMTLIR